MTIFTGFTGGDYAYQMANAVIFFIVTVVVSVAAAAAHPPPRSVALMADQTSHPRAPRPLPHACSRRRRRGGLREGGRPNWVATVLLPAVRADA